ncbi:hypothetical protein FA13DRAFT_1721985 [Coprinellus micaceus]|uniref:Uncharacterized protein n=1 Tax=Coprinellus micaceus TaxID=71717 RepID=A0A4Y7RV42_COPMI|nr:hypothetical protein FA13DRAFT_1721985 [Coprinellus micaceus]
MAVRWCERVDGEAVGKGKHSAKCLEVAKDRELHAKRGGEASARVVVEINCCKITRTYAYTEGHLAFKAEGSDASAGPGKEALRTLAAVVPPQVASRRRELPGTPSQMLGSWGYSQRLFGQSYIRTERLEACISPSDDQMVKNVGEL